MSDILDKSITGIGAALRAGKTTAAALHDAATANHEARPESFGAYKLWDAEAGRKQAHAGDAAFAAGIDMGPLQGLPISVKDLYGVRGWPTFAGTPKRWPKSWESEGPVIAALRAQLGVIVGKTHTVEFAFGGIGMNPHWDTPRNPWDAGHHRAPGGSSAGAGVSLCAGSAVLALGTDTAGSVRIPASMTGNAGLKTSQGRWSIEHIAPLSPSLDTPGILARSVADLAVGFVAIDPLAGEPPRPAEIAGLRLGISEGLLWEDCSPGVAEGVKEALDTLGKKGARLLSIPFPEAEEIYPVFRVGGLVAVELHTFVTQVLPEWLEVIDPIIVQRMSEAAELPAHEYVRRRWLMDRLGAAIDERLRDIDVIVCPTVPITPPILADIAEIEAYRPANLLALRNTGVVNYLGLCALTVPVALDQAGMPVGLQLIARHGHEERLLSIGLALENELGNGRERLGKPPMIG
ncbi:MAG: amidase [Alphaproteobacteria bacterium]